MRLRSVFWFLQLVTAVWLSGQPFSQKTTSFAPLERWKAALISGSSASLTALYSTNPSPQLSVVTKKAAEISPQADVQFWSGLKARRVLLNVAQSTAPQLGLQQLNFEATVK